MSSRYRRGVCVVLKRQAGTRVLVCRRIGSTGARGWQFPQGGVRRDERRLIDEARRELREEIGTDDIGVLAVSKRRYCYDIPESRRRPESPYVGQCHRWILAVLNAPDSVIRFDLHAPEFEAFEWVEPAEALKRVVPFKKMAYRAAMQELGLLPEGNARARADVKQ